MKTAYINKLQPEYKEYVLSKEPGNFQEANRMAVALWRRKNPEGIPLKPKSIFAVEAEFGLEKNSDMSEEESEIEYESQLLLSVQTDHLQVDLEVDGAPQDF